MHAPRPTLPLRVGMLLRAPFLTAGFAVGMMVVGGSTGEGLDPVVLASGTSPVLPEQAGGEPFRPELPLLPQSYELSDEWRGNLPWPGLYHPEGIDVADDGLILVAETGNHRVSAWGASGDRKGEVGGEGTGLGQFLAPEDLAVDDARQRVYVADTGNRRIVVLQRRWAGFDLALSALEVWDDVGLPRGIAVEQGTGRVFVSDAEGDRVLVLDEDGMQVGVWGGSGTEAGQLKKPLGMDIGADGMLYIADSGNLRVQWWDPASGEAVGELKLDHSTGPGGEPTDVGLDDRGDLFIAVERGVLRYRGRTTPAATMPPLEDYIRGECQNPCNCVDYRPVVASHEGVRRLAVDAEIGVFFTYAPGQRRHDRIVAHPKRGFERVMPRQNCDSLVSPRHVYDPSRIDAGEAPYAAQMLDTTPSLRVYKPDGSWLDVFSTYHGGPGMDVAVDGNLAYHSFVLTGNQVRASSLLCTLGCPPSEVKVLDDRMMLVRDRVGEFAPDFGWWLRALAVRSAISVLDAGKQRLIVREGFACGARTLSCTDRSCNSRPNCDPVPERQLISGVDLQPRSQPFRGFSDLAHDFLGNTLVLAREGALLTIDPRGRRQDDLFLKGLRNRTTEALALSFEESGVVSFVLTGDGWVFKQDDNGQILAAFEVAALAGPGRYRDLSLDTDGRLLIPDGAADRVLVFERNFEPDEPSHEPPDPRGGPCGMEPQKTASPSSLPLGQSLSVRLSLGADCGSKHTMRDVVLAIDASCQMTGERLAKIREAGVYFINAMTQGEDRVGIVSFNDEADSARLLAPLTEDKGQLRAALSNFRTDCLPPTLFPQRRGDARMSVGLRAGRETLFGPSARAAAGKALVLLSPSTFDREQMERWQGRFLPGAGAPVVFEREQALWESWRLWDAGARVYTVAVGMPSRGIGPPEPPAPDLMSTQPSDKGLLSALSNPASGFRDALSPGDLPQIYEDMGREISDRKLFASLVITDRIPTNMRLVPGSVQPPAATLPDGSLQWELGQIPLGGAPVISYILEPQEVGRHPTNVEAAAVYTDGLDYAGRVLFPVPYVDVIGPTAEASATPPPADTPTPGPVPPPSDTPSGPATRIPTTGPTPLPTPLYLPLLFYEQCIPKSQPLDVVLLIDTSSSMNGEKIDAARNAGRSLVALLSLPQDRAAVIGFDDEVRVAQSLSGDRAAIDAALAGLFTNVGTRIDLGLWAAIDQVAGASRRRGADPVIVLLTDGRPQLGTETSMRQAAKLARDIGIAVYAIGLGEDVLDGVLLDIAGDPERVYLAPGPGDLAAIYEQVARLIPCR